MRQRRPRTPKHRPPASSDLPDPEFMAGWIGYLAFLRLCAKYDDRPVALLDQELTRRGIPKPIGDLNDASRARVGLLALELLTPHYGRELAEEVMNASLTNMIASHDVDPDDPAAVKDLLDRLSMPPNITAETWRHYLQLQDQPPPPTSPPDHTGEP